ncbi:MAG: hypothetical protein ABIR30_10155 [Chitinophagaceae bacterium]
MENKFNNRDFEQYVKQNADQYRMFPSDKVWKGIHNTLHTRRRWYGIGLGLLLLTTATVTGVMLNPSGKKQQAANELAASPAEKKQSPDQQEQAAIIIPRAKPVNEKIAFVTAPERFQQDLFIAGTSAATAPIINDYEEFTAETVSDKTEPVLAPLTLTLPEYITRPVAVASENKPQAAIASKPPSANPVIASKPKIEQPLFISFTIDEKNKPTEQAVKEKEVVLNLDRNLSPFTIESVINAYKHTRLMKKLSWQVYFTPTVTYRKLRENEAFLNASRPYTASPTNQTTDVNSVVTHKPDLGMQLGFTAGYPISKKLRITTGLQFNVSKYDIRAFTYPSEVATIALSTAAGGANTVSTFTTYRNSGSSAREDWLRNLYISASAPVGLEYKVIGNKRSYAGVAASIQPTFILSNRAYLISTDYKNYAEVPSLVRKWNVNTGFEIFAGYTTGKLNWRLSPQVRYQALSSFEAKYPVKEHLFDFGVKLGLMLRN